ncbi:ATP-dependent zinc protease [Candidatus Woesearchaeota archaeon]|nr:ATP-dependent zinc protease [Candidatus Woesearchaeota archaeon]
MPLKREIIGLTEPIKIGEEEIMARIDTGAKYNSICKTLAEKLSLGPPIKTIRIKSSTGKERRSMVQTEIEMKGRKLATVFNIADRQHMKYDVLIGYDLLKKEGFLIDPTL